MSKLWLKCKAVDYDISNMILLQDDLYYCYKEKIKTIFDDDF